MDKGLYQPFYRAVGDEARKSLDALRSQLKRDERAEWQRGKELAELRAKEKEVAKAHARLARNLKETRGKGWALQPAKRVKTEARIKGSVFTAQQVQNLHQELLKEWGDK